MANVETRTPKKQNLKGATLSRLPKEELIKRDVFGRTILHLLILCNRSDLLKHLLKNPEAKILINKTDYENGWNCLHYIVFFKRFSCYKVLSEYLRTLNGGDSLLLANNTMLFELIRCKDRTRATPLQLLSNDLKDILWYPEYITAEDEVHFKYRFEAECAEDNEDKKSAYQRTIRMLKDQQNWWDNRRAGSDVYMFGSNLNNNLGVGDSTNRQIPCKLLPLQFDLSESPDILKRFRFKAVKLSKNHSILLTKDGALFSCGIGSRGRLGHGIECMKNCYRFKKIEFFSDSGDMKVRDCSVSADHSIALTSGDQVYSWGLNTFGQLGAKLAPNGSSKPLSKEFSEDFEAVPRLVFGGDLKKTTSHLRGTAVSRIHSLVFSKHEIIFWGLNIGQMGFAIENGHFVDYKVNGVSFKGSVQSQPRSITLRDEIKLVQTSDTCTCVVTVNNEIHLYFQSQHVKLPKVPSRGSGEKDFHIFSPTKLTRPSNIVKVCMRSPENIVLLLESGDVLGCSIDIHSSVTKMLKNIKYQSIWKSHDRDLRINDCDTSYDGSIVLTTTTGLVYVKHSNLMTRKNSMSESSLPVTPKNKFRRIDYVNRIVQVSCDESFSSFGFIRDDIDQIPFQLETNSYIKDMEYLSTLSGSNLYRKQNELFDASRDSSYKADFLYPKYEEDDCDSDEEDIIEAHDTNTKLDSLLSLHVNKFDPNQNKRVRTRFTYEQILDQDIEFLKDLLKISSTDALIEQFLGENDFEEKNYDSAIGFKNYHFGIHKRVFCARSTLFRKLLEQPESQYFSSENIEGSFVGNVLEFTTEINVKSLLIFIHFVYTNKIVAIWEDYPSGIHCPTDIKEVKTHFELLCRVFALVDIFGSLTKNDTFLLNMRSLYELDQIQGDVTFRLSDGELKSLTFILTARSAYFETNLARRWNPKTDIIELENVSKLEFDLVLKHLYGFSDFVIFNQLIESSGNTDEFISTLLNLIQISDELLLFHLKNLCQLAIKDLITLENVVILLIEADELRAKKLFICCCWYIFNNLEITLLDPSFLMIPSDVLEKLEGFINVFDKCKHLDFIKLGVMDTTYLNNWMNKQSNTLVNEFITCKAQFNEHFMSDRKGFASFTPLFDVKIEQDRIDAPRRNRRSSRKSSTNHEFKAELAEVRKAALIQASKSENAIDVDEDFELVVPRKKGSRKVDFQLNSKSSSPTPSVPNNSVPAESAKSKPRLDSFPVLGKRSGSFVGSCSNGNGTSTSPVANALNPHSNWASKNSGVLTPVLGQKVDLTDSRKPKVKIGPTLKLSQKERKKLALKLNESVASSALRTFSWGSASDNDVETRNSNSVSPNGFPPLSQAKRSPSPKDSEEADSSFESSNLSLTEIMLEESLRIEQAKQAELQRKSLQEIQQEEEFAKWWEEETKRVQQQMQAVSLKKPKRKPRRHTNDKK